MRKEYGVHIGFYRVVGVDGPIIERGELEKYYADHGVVDFEYGLVAEFLK
jgi:hypothetical protein